MIKQTTAEKLQLTLGWNRELATQRSEEVKMKAYLDFQLAAANLMPAMDDETDSAMTSFSLGILENLREKTRLLTGTLPPIDQRIEAFLARYFADVVGGAALRLPQRSLVLDRHGMARTLSLPMRGDAFDNSLLSSRRCYNGIINNPASDRRTTAGTFHIVEGGLPIPGDKRAVPKTVYAALFRHAMNPPDESLVLPYTSETKQPSKTWVSLMLRPIVRPEVPGYCEEMSMEVRFFAPGSLVSNLDFVESIFGNAGDPLIPEHDSGLDAKHWSGHTGCVILAPHLVHLTKKELGLPHHDQATERQRQDGMCYRDPAERYNGGSAFKLTCRDDAGVVVTLIADNYYGYCKKEVKTQLSYAANLMGGVEEEHAGGAVAFPSYSLGDSFQVNSRRYNQRTFADVARDYASFIDVKPEGYGVDKHDPTIFYIPENALVTLTQRCVRWNQGDTVRSIPLKPEHIYIAPSGYKIRLERHPNAPSWRLIGTVGEGLFCHKPCTVSGGGKSEISKSLRDYMLYGPIFVKELQPDFAKLDEIFSRNYQDRWRDDYASKPDYSVESSRSVLSPSRSLGSVIQLLTPSPDYSAAYNAWLETIPDHVYAMALIIKRFSEPGVEANWRDHFGVDIVNGAPGHELKYHDRSLVGTYLRVGLVGNQWRTFKVRQDFIPASKVQREDDISVSIVVPANRLDAVEHPGALGSAVLAAPSYKFVENCEYRLFQRPDDAIHRGLDKQTEIDLARPGNFISNFEPLDRDQAFAIVDDAIDFEKYSEPMRQMLQSSVNAKAGYVVSSAHLRQLEDGTLSKNPRYLQDRPDMVNTRETYVAYRGMQLFRGIPEGEPVHLPVGAILCGRRNNPPDPAAGIRSLAVYNPLHYQELPELIMDFISSLTGKSPSTTGAGSEGALTKGPFNMLSTTADLNTAIVSMILTGLGGYSTPAGHIGPDFEVGHDISLLIPEVFCRMTAEERDPQALIAAGMLERLSDFQHDGKTVLASRLGYRATGKFVRTYLARVFDNPGKVFSKEILRPELQDMGAYVEGIHQITEAQARVANRYFEDGTYESACPPLRALLDIMAHGHHEGQDASSPKVRELFTLQSLLASDWYRERLQTKQFRDVEFWRGACRRIEGFLADPDHHDVTKELDLQGRLNYASQQLAKVTANAYLDELAGTLGADPLAPVDSEIVRLA